MLLTFSIIALAATPVNAHTPPQDIPTYAYITAAPDPVGVDQTVTLVFWLDKIPPTAAGAAGDRWTDMTIDVTKPDGSTDNLGPFMSDPVGGSYAFYTPSQTGKYIFTFNFPGQTASLYHPTSGLPGSQSAYVNDTYLPSTATTTLTVQETKIVTLPDTPLPSTYWTRPIEGQNTNWATIASNYLAGSAITGHYQPDGTAPSSPHIMWTKPLSFGGVVGGSNVGVTGMTFYDGTNYEGKFSDPLIIYGQLYYSLPRSDATTGGGYVCVDLRTGETLWHSTSLGNTIKAPSFGQLYDYESMNQHGVIPNGYLWSATGGGFMGPPTPANWTAYDPLDGTYLFSLTNVPAGSEVMGPNGEILRYILNTQGNWLAVWNNTAAQTLTASTDPTDYTSSNYYQWRPVGKTADASNAISWNVTIPSLPATSTIVAASYNDMIIVSTPLSSFLTFGTPTTTTVSAISIKDEDRGRILWTKNIAAPTGNQTRAYGPFDASSRVFTYFDKETISYTGYSMDTGDKLWGPTASENPWNYYSGAGGAMTTVAAAEGKLYSTGYSGVLYCYDIKTGDLLWTYVASSGLETPYSGYPLGISGIADGKIYLATNEHSSGAPYWRGAKMRCVDIDSGEELWTLYGHGASSYGDGGAAIADGYLAYLNLYDMQIYSIGKGPSKTTIEAPTTAVRQGDGVVIRGFVTDVCAGAKAKVESGEFNQVAAVSDASQAAYMEHIYMQKPLPDDVTGVSVKLSAISENGEETVIDTVVSDGSGFYKKLWTPSQTGTYTIVASFEGSNSYWSSQAQTAIAVVSAQAEPTMGPSSSPSSSTSDEPIQTPSQTVVPASPTAAAEPESNFPTETLLIVVAAVVIVAAAQ